jgi:hypothetical protein
MWLIRCHVASLSLSPTFRLPPSHTPFSLSTGTAGAAPRTRFKPIQIVSPKFGPEFTQNIKTHCRWPFTQALTLCHELFPQVSGVFKRPQASLLKLLPKCPVSSRLHQATCLIRQCQAPSRFRLLSARPCALRVGHATCFRFEAAMVGPIRDGTYISTHVFAIRADAPGK